MDDLSKFMDRVTAWYVMDYNFSIGRKGKLLKKNFGSAPKWNDKSVRTSINYVGNNPVEKYLCANAEDYRWNFLAYAKSDHPFSDPIVLKTASRQLRRVLKEVDGTAARNKHLTYAQLQRLFAALDNKERNQLIDYIIVRYNVIRYDVLTASCYDGYDNMLLAINSNAGSEYEIHELKFGTSDAEYKELYKYVHKAGYKDAGMVVSLPIDTKLTLMLDMLNKTTVPKMQICKFLHLRVASK